MPETDPGIATQLARTLIKRSLNFLDQYRAGLEPYGESIDQTLYHYTQLGTLESIIRNDDLWLFDAESCNDADERIGGLRTVHWEIRKPLTKLEAEALGDITDEHRQSDLRRYALHLGTSLLKTARLQFFITSLCAPGQPPDDPEAPAADILSMWRGYAVNATGVSVGFYQSDLGYLLKPHPAIAMFPVVYRYEEHAALTRFLVVAFSEMLLERTRPVQGWIFPAAELRTRPSEVSIATCYKAGRIAVRMLCLLMKHPGFREEREVRILFCRSPESRTIRVHRLEGAPWRNFVKFSALMGKKHSGLNQWINHVVLGPAADQQAAMAVLAPLASEYKFAVQQSHVPFRGTKPGASGVPEYIEFLRGKGWKKGWKRGRGRPR